MIINFIGNSNKYRENKTIQSTPKKLCKGSKDKKQKTKYFWEKNRETKPQEATLMWFLWANIYININS